MKKTALIALVMLSTVSCTWIDALKHSVREFFGEEVVARVGSERLYRSALEDVVPRGLSPEDSVAFVRQYINSWASEKIFLDVADKELSKSEKDVTKELEDYRMSLLKYRFEQRYINERLDTVITEHEIRSYYEANPERFILQDPIVKVRYMVIPASSKSLKKITEKMSSNDVVDVLEAETLASSAAIRYVDHSEKWMDILPLALEARTDVTTLLGAMNKSFIRIPDSEGNLFVAYVTDMVRKGKPAPLEYCTDRIRDIILSSRKHDLVTSLEQDLLEDARSNGKFKIL